MNRGTLASLLLACMWIVSLALPSPVGAEVMLQCISGEPDRPGLKMGVVLERPFELDYRYRPPSWQTSICLPDDWQKTLVRKDGAMLYHFPSRGKSRGFGTEVQLSLSGDGEWVAQRLERPRNASRKFAETAYNAELADRVYQIYESEFGQFGYDRDSWRGM